MRGLVRGAARALGFDFVRWPGESQPTGFDVQRQLFGQRDDLTIFDVGAQVGTTSRTYRRLFPKSMLHAFEPLPRRCASLRTSFEDDPRYRIHQIALSDSNGEADLSVNHSDATSSLLAADTNAPPAWKPLVKTERMLPVHTTTLDAFCSEHGVSTIDILKLDVQGVEARVLAGAEKLLARRAIKLIYLEVIVARTYIGQSRPDEIFKRIYDSGLYLVDIYNITKSGPFLLQFDALYSCPELIRGMRAGELEHQQLKSYQIGEAIA